MIKDYETIKKYSDSYAKMMRDLFPQSFENEELNNILYNIVFNDEKTIFALALKEQKKELEFKQYIYSLVNVEKQENKSCSKSVSELLSDAGYDFYIINNPEDTDKFRKYYDRNELICSFNSSDRKLNCYRVFWIVKKNIQNIKRSLNPTRQDDYWTSCCSIKISDSDIYITNRYNHTVNNPDNTFNSNLDNIIEGLTVAFEKEFNLNLKFQNKKSKFELKKFTFKWGKFLYFNYEINNIYYWINKYYKDWQLFLIDTQNYILLDYFLINLKEKRFEIIDKNIKDDFLNFKFNKIIIKKDKDNNFENEEDEEDTLIIYK